MASRPSGREGFFGSGIDAVPPRTGSASLQSPFLCCRLDVNHGSAAIAPCFAGAVDKVVGKDQASRAKRGDQ